MVEWHEIGAAKTQVELLRCEHGGMACGKIKPIVQLLGMQRHDISLQ